MLHIIRNLKIWFLNLKINIKMWLCMLTVMLSLVFSIGWASLNFFTDMFMQSSNQRAQNTLTVTDRLFYESYRELLLNVVKLATSDTFRLFVQDSLQNGKENYTQNYNNLQEKLSQLKNSSDLIYSVLVAGKNGELYSLYDTRLKDLQFSELFTIHSADIHQLTWLPVQNGNVTGMPDVIPVFVPLTRLETENYLVVAEWPGVPVVTIILLLNAAKVSDFLSQTLPAGSKDAIYLADEQGISVNLETTSPLFSAANNAIQIKSVSSADSGFATFQTGQEYISYVQSLNLSGLRLVHLVSKSVLFRQLRTIRFFILVVALAALAVTTVLSFVLSKLITRPLSRLTGVVGQIQSGTYHKLYVPRYTDEVGQLTGAVNTMYATIQKQMQQIKQNERAKMHYEMQLFAEQINPHFLYNTLECIDLEVLNQHSETASFMVENLGEFLRIGLNRGEDTIPVEKELAHVKAYFNIMNSRFNSAVQFQSEIAPELAGHRILKTILQPLVENSFKHGFRNKENYTMIQNPVIEIIFLKQGNMIVIEAADNGYGIDIAKAEASLTCQSSERHIGLQNVYQRLCIFYGSAHIQFQSIPFFRNSVIITIPYSIL
jgi:two-component system, sensor histidine kinase YesM